MNTTAREIPIRYDESTHTYRLPGDRERGHSISTTIVLAVSEVTNTPAIDIEPMYEVVDPDALDDLHAPMDNAAIQRGGCSTFFWFHGCGVTVHRTGEIEIQPPGDADAGVDTSQR